MGFTYKSAGVDMERGDELVDRIKPLAARTRIPEMLSGVGGFAGMCALPSGLRDPILVSGTDGVGTKLKLAFLTGVHNTIGQDLVAMCVNDVVTCGARPLFFLDYFATGKLNVDVAEAVIGGIANACKLSGCALLGGETAEMPGFYGEGEYDLAGFSVGVIERHRIIDGKSAVPGNVVLGVPSTGLHSNGYSLARRVLLEKAGIELDAELPEYRRTLAQVLLEPTALYAQLMNAWMASTVSILGAAHITGGGLPGNIPRVLPDGLGVRIRTSQMPNVPIFSAIAEHGNIEPAEMRRTFNMGIGMAVIVSEAHAQDAMSIARTQGFEMIHLGETVKSDALDDDRVQFV